ncbi:MAG: dTMP kinase [Bacillota bacterium]
MAGFFITLEGIEGSGKTTQQKNISSYLTAQGEKVLLTREPGATRLGEQIRNILLDPDWVEMTSRAEILLYAADRAQHIEEVVRPALAEDKIVISDRYYDSNIAYQGYGRGLDVEMVEQINNWAVSYLTPDLTILFDLPVEVGLSRVYARSSDKKGDRLEREKLSFHKRVRRGYLQLAESLDRFVIVDADRPSNQIKAELNVILKERLYNGG